MSAGLVSTSSLWGLQRGQEGGSGSGPWAAVGAAFRQAQFESRAALWGWGAWEGDPALSPTGRRSSRLRCTRKVSWPEAQQRGPCPSPGPAGLWSSTGRASSPPDQGSPGGERPHFRSWPCWGLGAGQGAAGGGGSGKGGPEHESAHALLSRQAQADAGTEASGASSSQAWSPADRRPGCVSSRPAEVPRRWLGVEGAATVSAGP